MDRIEIEDFLRTVEPFDVLATDVLGALVDCAVARTLPKDHLLLEEGGLGRNGRKAGPETVGDFLYRLPEYRAVLEARPHEGNERLLGALDELLADGAARLEELRVAQRA